MKIKVVMSEQHTLFPQQLDLLNDRFKKWEYLKVPSTGWSLDQMKYIVKENVEDKGGVFFVFASPIPAMMALIYGECHNMCGYDQVYPLLYMTVFHNDKRDAKEITLPDGGKRVIHTVSKEGWVIV